MVGCETLARAVRGLVAVAASAGLLAGCGPASEPAIAPAPPSSALPQSPPTLGLEQFGGQASIAATPGSIARYCAVVARVRAAQVAPPAAGNQTESDSAVALHRLQEVANASPAATRADWQVVIDTTNRSLQLLAAASNDVSTLDRKALFELRAQAVPAAQRIGAFTRRHCQIDYTPPT